MRVLQVSPRFHGIWRSVERAFQDRDHDCVTHLYDERSAAGRIGYKLAYELPERLGSDRHEALSRRVTEAALGALRATRPDAVVVVKGDVLGDAFWEEVAGLRHVVWLYDQLTGMRHPVKRLAALNVATFSHDDAAELERLGGTARYLPLAHDPALGPGAVTPRRDVVSFVGARYPARERLVLALLERGVRVEAYGRDWSHHWVDRLRTWDLRRPPVPAGRELGREAAHRLMAESVATLNMHGAQDGFTLRTFEACGVGAVQLIDRPDVAAFYEPGREIAVYSGVDELVELCWRARRDTAWAQELREEGRRRTLAEHTFGHRVAVLEELLG